MTPIVYTKWGLANRFSDCIELNEALKKYPKIHDAIIQHELDHKEENTFKQDLVHDLKPINKINQKDLIFFMFKHPKTFTQFLPLYWSSRRKQFVYDMNMIIIYGIVIGAVALLLLLV